MLKAARIVLGKGAHWLSTATILKRVGWKGIDQVIANYTLRLAVTTVLTGTPKNLNSRINRIPARETRAKTRGDRILPSWHSVRGKQSYTFRAVQSLNAMPKAILQIKDKTARGKQIKLLINQTVSPYCGNRKVSAIQLTVPAVSAPVPQYSTQCQCPG